MAAALESYLSESVVFLVVAGLLAVLLSLAARRMGGPRALGQVQLLARLPLEARRSVYVVRVVDRVLILGSSEAGLTKLGELPEQTLLEQTPERNETPFGRLLEGVWRSSKSAPVAGTAAGREARPPERNACAPGPGSEEG